MKALARKKRDRGADALRRLKVSKAALATVPQITPLLKQADGGLAQVFAAMRFCPDEVISKFLEKYDSIPVGDQPYLSIESVALAAEIDVSHLLGSIMVCLQAQSVNAVKIIAVTSHPKITQARVEYGLLPLGEKDRTALDTAMGFLPSPKGPTFISKMVFGTGASAMHEQRGDDEDEGEVLDANGDQDMDRLFPPANTMQEKLNAIRQKALPPPGR